MEGRKGLRIAGAESKPMHLSSENGSSLSSKSDSYGIGLGGGGMRVNRVHRCLCDGGGGGGLRWADWVGLSLSGTAIGPVVVEMREMGRFLESELMRGKIRVGCRVSGREIDMYVGPSSYRQRPGVPGGGVGNGWHSNLGIYSGGAVGPPLVLT